MELWFATFGDRVYLSHEGDATDWMKNIRKNPTVKIRIGKVELAAKATSTKLESESREAGKKALYEKYYGPASKAVLDDWFELSEVLEILPTK